jgi:two-component system chemotaxis response regulator CheB
MASEALVVVGASAGGVEALCAMAAGLPADLPAAVLVVLHVPRGAPSALPQILNRCGPLPASHALDGELLRVGHTYVAPADRHLIVLDGRIRLSRGPVENGYRPAIDPLFRSAARAAGARTIAVVLSGARDDGTAGAASVADHGGRVLVQDPADALHSSMPRSVLDRIGAIRACPATELGAIIGEMVAALPARDETVPAQPLSDGEIALSNLGDLSTADLPAHPSGLACPSCNGGLFELPGEPVPRYRCWVGHAWSPETLLDEQAVAFEGALWTALRTLEEKAALLRRMRDGAEQRGYTATASRYGAIEDETTRAGNLIRELIKRLDLLDRAAGLPEPAPPQP